MATGAPDWTGVFTGTVDVNTVASGNVMEVINSPGTVVGIGASQATIYNLANGSFNVANPNGGTLNLRASIANNTIPPTNTDPSPVHALYISGGVTLSSGALSQLELSDSVTGQILFQIAGFANVTKIQDQVIPFIATGNDLILTYTITNTTAGVNLTMSGNVIIVAYTSSVPPDPRVGELILSGLFTGGPGSTSEFSQANTTMQNLLNVLTLNTANTNGWLTSWWDNIGISDSVAPIDTASSGAYTAAAGAAVIVHSSGGNREIIRRISWVNPGVTTTVYLDVAGVGYGNYTMTAGVDGGIDLPDRGIIMPTYDNIYLIPAVAQTAAFVNVLTTKIL